MQNSTETKPASINFDLYDMMVSSRESFLYKKEEWDGKKRYYAENEIMFFLKDEHRDKDEFRRLSLIETVYVGTYGNTKQEAVNKAINKLLWAVNAKELDGDKSIVRKSPSWELVEVRDFQGKKIG